jgi:hypothetical protein
VFGVIYIISGDSSSDSDVKGVVGGGLEIVVNDKVV